MTPHPADRLPAAPDSRPFIVRCDRIYPRPAAGAEAWVEALAIGEGRILAAGSLVDAWSAVGSDADITIWDPDRQVTIRNDLLHHNVDYTPYEGRTVTGWPETVISRGEIVIVKSQIAAEAGRGHFLPCARFEHWKDLRA